jgi:enoyl-CoA hydratase/carnithine racemase
MNVQTIRCSEDVKLRLDDVSATLELTRPDQLNAIRPETLDGLSSALDLVDESGVGLIVVRGSGRAFCAGADIGALDSFDNASSDAFTDRGQRLFARLADARAVSLAVVHGFAVGGGLELALACDIRVAGRSAQFGNPESTLGHLPAWGGTQRLPALVGRAAALDLIITGRRILADEAEQIGLVDQVVDDELLDATVETKLKHWTNRSPLLLRLIKEAVHSGQRSGPQAGLLSERLGMALTRAQPSSEELRASFLTSGPQETTQ